MCIFRDVYLGVSEVMDYGKGNGMTVTTIKVCMNFGQKVCQ